MNDVAPTPDLPPTTPEPVAAAPTPEPTPTHTPAEGTAQPVDVQTQDPTSATNTPPEATQPTGDDWRASMSGGDEKKMKIAERYSSPQAMMDALIAAQQKISSGDFTPTLGENPSDAELAAYREAHGIPDSPDKYEYKLPEGFNFGNEDQPYLDSVLEAAHKSNAPPAIVDGIINAYANVREQEAARQYQLDTQQREQVEDALRSEYGNEYRANHERIKNFIGTAPQEVQDMLLNGRGPDGRAFLNNLDMVRWLNDSVVGEIYGGLHPTEMGGRDAQQVVADELKTLEADMNRDITAWRKSPEKRKRYVELLEAQERINSRKV